MRQAGTNQKNIKSDNHVYYKDKNMFNLDGIDMPAEICDNTYKKFEKQNEKYALNVFIVNSNSTSRKDLNPVYVSKHIDRIILSLLITYTEIDNITYYHYTSITKFDCLFRETNSTHTTRTCPRCFHTFNNNKNKNDEALAAHIVDCLGVTGGGVQRVNMPTADNNILKFTALEKMQRHPFSIYLDFESSLVPITEADKTRTQKQYEKDVKLCNDTGGNMPDVSTSKRLTKHIANSFNARAVDMNGDLVEEIHYVGPNAAKVCIEKLLVLSNKLKKKLNQYPDVPTLTKKEQRIFNETKICYLCNEPLGRKSINNETEAIETEVTVIDHCHATGIFRGAAHQVCNLKCHRPKEISCFVHNLQGYDSHLLMQEMETFVTDKTKLSVVALNSEKYLSFKIGNLCFKDSYSFLSSGLDTLARGLVDENLKHTKQLINEFGVNLNDFREYNKKSSRFVMRKGAYPYCYVDSQEKFKDTSLPPIEAFNSDLSGEKCSAENYEYAKKVWGLLKCKTFLDYHNFYLRLDVTLLTDVFETFRKSSMKMFGLDANWYFGLPGLAWDSMLKFTGVKLELMTDIDMYIAMENMIRGGVTMSSHRHYKANNPKVDGYDDKKTKTWLRYDDANSLYPTTMVQNLPREGFKWGKTTHWTEEKIMSLDPNGENGIFLEVDVDYPDELHDAHNEYPLMPEKLAPTYSMLSDYARQHCGTDEKHYKSCAKLVPNLMNKRKYWIHYRNLQFAIDQGLKLIKVHRVIEFKQSCWMKKYIDFCVNERKNSKNEFEKDLYKLYMNIVYGKSLQNVRNHRDIQVMHTDKKPWSKFVAEPSYVSRENITDKLVIAERKCKNLNLNKPMYIGAAVLDLSKLHMTNFWYNYIKKEYPGEKSKLIYTDTDSLIYALHSEVEPMFKGGKGDWFDNSGLPKNHPMYDPTNEKALNCFKCEANGKAIAEVVTISAKMYAARGSIVDEDGNPIKSEIDIRKCKGVSKSVVKNEITFSTYLDVLQNGKSTKNNMTGLRSDLHQIYTTSMRKTSLNPFDNKRYLTDSINSLAYGHKDIKNIVRK
jgi:hypothetical protein